MLVNCFFFLSWNRRLVTQPLFGLFTAGCRHAPHKRAIKVHLGRAIQYNMLWSSRCHSPFTSLAWCCMRQHDDWVNHLYIVDIVYKD